MLGVNFILALPPGPPCSCLPRWGRRWLACRCYDPYGSPLVLVCRCSNFLCIMSLTQWQYWQTSIAVKWNAYSGISRARSQSGTSYHLSLGLGRCSIQLGGCPSSLISVHRSTSRCAMNEPRHEYTEVLLRRGEVLLPRFWSP